MTLLCWLLGHEPVPKWDGEDPWCARCESYVPSEECRTGPAWRRWFGE